ncbi:probable disease resistance protein At4g19530 [Macadamia integrifolia]|uniref:probable disease resistance protein At4g19530 n=1 Tax=Macadamia integrifolia TaxID=60698 RepID=UPI001C4F0EDD|nr:probable disease resistance protein At4g19530 [Macadamia integrifolia]
MIFTTGQCLMQRRNGLFSYCIQDLPYKINGEEDLNSITSPRLLPIRNCNFMAVHDRASYSFSGSFTNYDVFLNFRVEDTCNNFTGFIYRTLKREVINMFIDSAQLWGRKEMKPMLLKVIRGSKISTPVFSKNHAGSKQCLLELEEMVKCHRYNGQKILPIFYDVEPTDVRHQTSGSFARSFHRHGKKLDAQAIENWKQALTFTAGKKGYDLKQVKWNQPKLVDLIVDWVLRELSSNRLGDAKSPIEAASPSDLVRANKRVHHDVDEEVMRRANGEHSTPALEAIRGSKISIPIFSQGYAESKWCLMELEEMVLCHRSNGQKILPVFYDVEPTNVRHQTSKSFARPFQRYEEKFDSQAVQNWKEALNFVGGKEVYNLKQVIG